MLHILGDEKQDCNNGKSDWITVYELPILRYHWKISADNKSCVGMQFNTYDRIKTQCYDWV